MKKEDEFCMCENSKGVYTVNGEFGYWYHCSDCNNKIEDGFHYYDTRFKLV
jgi:hypothetical protein